MLLAERFIEHLEDPAHVIAMVHQMEGERERYQAGFNTAASIADASASMATLTRMGLAPFKVITGGINPLVNMQDQALKFWQNSLGADARLIRHLASPIQRVELDLDGITINGENIISKEQPVHSDPFFNITHVARTHEDGSPLDRIDPKVILIIPGSGHQKSLLLDTVRKLIPSSELYIVEQTDAAQIPVSEGSFGLDDNIDMHAMANRVVTAHDPYHGRAPQNIRANNISACEPGPKSLVAGALMSENSDPARAQSITVLASPIDVSKNPTSTNEFANSRDIQWFEDSVVFPAHKGLPGEGRMIYPAYIQRLAFIFKTAESASSQFKHMMKLRDNMFLGNEDEVQKKLKWDRTFLFDLASPNGELYLETVKRIFQDNAIGRGEYDYRGSHRVDMSKLDMSIIAGQGSHDDICGPDQTIAALELASGVKSSDKVERTFDAGHYMFAGSVWDQKVGPWVMAEIRGKDTQLEYSPLPAESLPKIENKAIAHEPIAA